MPLPTDPMLSQQWHISNPTPGLLDLNVLPVWNPLEGPAYTGAGVRIVVIDDGFDYLHSDLAPNYDTVADFDFDEGDLDPFGGASDAHGTAVTGIIGAAANGTGVVGIAYNSTLIGYRTHGFITDFWLQNIRDAIHHAAASADGDVVNISQGIANDLNSEFGVGYNAVRFDEIETSIGTAVNTGRGGLGTIIVKSAGNSRGGSYDVNADDWSNDTRQVVVAAVDQNGFVSSYSSYGAAVLVSGFGTPGQVVTTDRTGAAGYDPGDFTSSFNGTSSAAPMVTGVVGLMLEANGDLGWRDVQSILAASARHVGSAVGGGIAGSERHAWEWNAATTWNGGGMHFSNDYGYGLVDAHGAVRLAETWLLTGTSAATSGNEFTNTMDVLNTSTVIPDGNATGLSFTGTAGFDDIIDRVTVEMSFSTTFTGDLEVYLTSPDGTEKLMIRDTGSSNDFNGTWTFESQAFRGERAAGTWTVRVVDDAGGDVLTVTDIIIRTWGAASTNDRYIYTDEYADYAGVGGHSTAVTDSNGGTDTVNAAAVTTNSVIRLDGVVGSIAGQAASFSGIENAIGGDGNDTIIGSGDSNMLFGMRGADSLVGGGGTDEMFGGTGNDTFDGGLGIDTLNGGTGNDLFKMTGGNFTDDVDGGDGTDTLDVSAIGFGGFTGFSIDLATGVYNNNSGSEGQRSLVSVENVVGSSEADDVVGASGSNRLEGNGGNDTLDGAAGNDSLYGGEGDDTLIQNFGTAVEIMDGGNGTDTGDWSYSGQSWIINLVAGTAKIGTSTWATLTSIENVRGASGNDSITGDGQSNVLEGQTGNDTLDGGAGIDTLEGGTGDDVYVVDSLNDVVNEYFGEGTDEIRTSLASYSIYSKTEIENLTGTSASGQILTGNGQDNVMTGASAADSMNGSSGNDTLAGNGGNDTLEGGSGNDSMTGGAGDDRYFVDSYGDQVVEAAGEGTDEIRTGLGSFSIFSLANVENLTGTSAAGHVLTGNSGSNVLTGNTGNDSLLGGENNDTLRGSGGNDTLDGGSGSDRMEGGSGNDSYLVENYGDDVVEAAGSGTDTIVTKLGSYSIFSNANVENLTGTGPISHTFTGNASNNVLTGNTGDDSLNGSGGNDTLIGSDGNDTLEGGSGNDSMTGGAGDDRYAVDSYSDQVVEGAGGGTDEIITSLSSYSIFSQTHIENLTGNSASGQTFTGNSLDNVLTGNNTGDDRLIGSAGNDTLIGNGGNDTLEGGSGANRMEGGAGNDTYVVSSFSDVLVEGAGQGTDTVLTALGAFSIFSKANVENITSTTSGSVTLTGNSLDNVLTGNNAGNDTLVGSSGNDTLIGLGGDDRLEGGTGTNRMEGGAGNDTYVVSSFSDVLVEGAGQGTDTVLTALGAYSIFTKANVENLTSTTSGSVTLTGNTLDNVLTGNNAGNDTLIGSSGNDTLIGLGGSDRLEGGSGQDAFVFNAALGAGNVDTIADFSVADDTIRLENAVFTALGAGALAASAFHIGASASTAAHRLIYNAASGQLFYDADGAGGSAQSLFATLGTGLAMTSADFLVI